MFHINRSTLAKAMRILIWTACAVVMVLLTGCPSDPPDPPVANSWALVMRCPDTLFRDEPGGHVINDTILVRLIHNGSDVVGGVNVHCRCEISRDSLTQFVTTYSDTIAHVAGCYPALMYWGAGSPDTAVYERIHCWALPDGPDTLRGSVQFKVFDPQ
ncbi:hypothetical protein EHM69_12530 [candidate division KSB1 bacterium]|nr:MAG: hypothetical protein EHM69_12530 [candidate division KSB1 bacterium]